jgi:hypothetical protein
MYRRIFSEKELHRYNRSARKRAKQGVEVDPVQYSGYGGSYTMVFDGTVMRKEFKMRDYSLLVGFNIKEIEKIVVKG